MASTQDPETKTYAGGCHCGRFRFTYPHAPFDDGQHDVCSCNCSICSKQGVLWIYGSLSDLQFTKGSFDGLTKYLFYRKLYPHHFCPTCGVELFESDAMLGKVGVNVRTLDGIDPAKLKVKFFDGRNLN